MRWRVALAWGVLTETLIASALGLYLFGVIPQIVFGGVPIYSVAFALHLPSSLLAPAVLGVTRSLGLSVPPSLLVAALIVGTFQAAFFAALAFGAVRHPKVSAAALAAVVVAFVATAGKAPPYPEGMDASRDRLVTMEEWIGFHANNPKFYGGYDTNGYITKGSADYYEREFKRVDCNYDSVMDAYEYGELHWDMRWCESDLRRLRPWWR